jgi:hypothetical protein
MAVRLFPAASAVVGMSVIAIAGTVLELSSTGACATQPKPAEISFSEDVSPILQFHCSSCHKPGGEGFEKSGLDVTTYASLMKGTKFGR